MFYSAMTARADTSTNHIDWNVNDKRGRKIGLSIFRETQTFEATDRGNGACFWNVEPGVYFTTVMTATRNGKRFGASQARQYFKTEGERESAINKRIGENQKAAGKLAA